MKVTVKEKHYFTNISDSKNIQKCLQFFSDGCSSYAVSFNNNEKDIIKETKIEGFRANYLRKMNFNECFVPMWAQNIKDSKQVLEKGLDLIELL